MSAVAAFVAVGYFRAAPALRSVPAGPLAAGATRVAPPGKAFSLDLPKGWIDVDPTAPKFIEAHRGSLERFNQSQGTHLEYHPTREALYAYDSATVHDPVPRTIGLRIKESRGTKVDPQKLASELGERLAKDVPGIRIFHAEAVRLPVGTVPRVVASFPLVGKDGETRRTTTITYSLRDQDRLITLTITGMERDQAEVTALGEQVAKSFRSLR